MALKFIKAKNNSDIKKIYDYNVDAFSDSPDFNWNLEEIQKEVKKGWELYSVNNGEEVIAAAFIKGEGTALRSKNTAIKINHQGSGFSHKIKDFFEETARDRKLKSIVHYCRIDNFRMYSLNESHGYEKSGTQTEEADYVVEWVKKLD